MLNILQYINIAEYLQRDMKKKTLRICIIRNVLKAVAEMATKTEF